MKDKKNICSIIMAVLMLCLLTACGNKMTTNKYDNEAILGIKIKKTEAYLDKLVITFADDSVSNVKKVEIDYYDANNSVVEEIPEFSFQNNVLAIETDHADTIFELRVWEKDRDIYFHVRYIYSEAYSMLVYSWAEDAGYLVNGDEDAFYTEEEKELQREQEEAQAEADALAFSSIRGEWMNENETVRIIIDENEENERCFYVFELVDGEWVESDFMVIRDISSFGDNTIALVDDPSFGRQVLVVLEEDNKMSFDGSEELYYRKSY